MSAGLIHGRTEAGPWWGGGVLRSSLSSVLYIPVEWQLFPREHTRPPYSSSSPLLVSIVGGQGVYIRSVHISFTRHLISVSLLPLSVVGFFKRSSS
jgi:hypothetical protein